MLKINENTSAGIGNFAQTTTNNILKDPFSFNDYNDKSFINNDTFIKKLKLKQYVIKNGYKKIKSKGETI